ncbi:MAG: hypothetical protein JNK77_03920 [Saprospiraceae bacterium]|nr:hypothetical protein [Saprospiraceae bacterium]
MNTNSHSKALTSTFSFDFWGLIAVLSFMLLGGLVLSGAFLFVEADTDKNNLALPFLFLYCSFILFLFWTTLTSSYSIRIAKNRVYLKTISKSFEFAESDITGFAVHKRYNSRHQIEILLLRIKSGQEFELFAHNYNNYPLLKAELTAGVPENIRQNRSYLRH